MKFEININVNVNANANANINAGCWMLECLMFDANSSSRE